MAVFDFDGYWRRGSELHVISGGRLSWADGSSSAVRHAGSGVIRLEGEELETSFEARLSPNGQCLFWNNGSMWFRAVGYAKPAVILHSVVADEQERADLAGLLKYLAKLKQEGVRTRRVLYVVNSWSLGGVIPFEHHGFVLELEGGRGFLTLNFGAPGIMWQRCKEQPEYPDGTQHVKSFDVRLDPGELWNYCAQTRPFSVFGNDCQAWAEGMMEHLRVGECKGQRVSVTRSHPGAAVACGCGSLHSWL